MKRPDEAIESYHLACELCPGLYDEDDPMRQVFAWLDHLEGELKAKDESAGLWGRLAGRASNERDVAYRAIARLRGELDAARRTLQATLKLEELSDEHRDRCVETLETLHETMAATSAEALGIHGFKASLLEEA